MPDVDGARTVGDDRPARRDETPTPGFVCSTCGRTNLPEAGDWDPPICQECDAAINDDAFYEEGAVDDL